MIYVFVFFGEFGYELFNWQGVVRKFAQTVSATDRIVCCSRAHVESLYEMATDYIDISHISHFQRSVASCYFALHPRRIMHVSRLNRLFDWQLRVAIRRYVLRRLDAPVWKEIMGTYWPQHHANAMTFVFSSEHTVLNGCVFGMERENSSPNNIYESLDIQNNLFQKIEPDLCHRDEIEHALGFQLVEPFILVQTRKRTIGPKSLPMPAKDELIQRLSQKMKVVLLSFQTQRHLDSYSAFDPMPNCVVYQCKSFLEQTCLITYARHCVFFTEGDFGSHIYVPPFMGKDVTAIAPESVYKLGTTPIAFWNANVFKFGGQIFPKVAETVFASSERIEEVAHDILAS